MPEKIVVFGIGAQTRIVEEIFSLSGKYKIEFIMAYDSNFTPGKRAYNAVVYPWEKGILETALQNGVTKAIVTHPKNVQRRKSIEKIKEKGFELINAIHPTASVSTSAELGYNIIVNANAVIQPYAKIGNGVVIHSLVNIGHDNVIGDYVNLATGANLAGWVVVEDGVYIYVNATVINRTHIGKDAVVGAGAVVMKNVPAGAFMMGNPAKVKWIKR